MSGVDTERGKLQGIIGRSMYLCSGLILGQRRMLRLILKFKIKIYKFNKPANVVQKPVDSVLNFFIFLF